MKLEDGRQTDGDNAFASIIGNVEKEIALILKYAYSMNTCVA